MNKVLRRLKRMKRKININNIINMKKILQFKHIKIFSTFMICISIFLTLMLLADSTFSVFLVSIQGKTMGHVNSKETVYEIIDSVERDLSDKYGTEVTIKDNVISFNPVKVEETMPLDEEAIIKELSKSENSFLKAWAISINNEKVAVLNSQEKAEQVLENIKSHYMKEGSQYLEVYFKETVGVEPVNANTSDLLNEEEALNYILTGAFEPKEHEVKSGESYWTIAEKYNISVEELEKANPDVNADRIQIGQKINLLIPKQYLTVVTVEKAVVTEKIQFDIAYEKTGVLFSGEEKIKLEGVYGIKETNTQVVRENGKEISTEVMDSAIIQEPEKQIVLIGTKAIPSSLGTGALDTPTRGMVTSVFGRRWGRMHTGVDIANDKGTPIIAADGGVVTFADWKGDYGLAVVISHGGNKTTLYGHCSEILVSKGDVVKKGDVIAKMGNTGRTTGTHLHFEVRINDTPQDPAKYIEY